MCGDVGFDPSSNKAEEKKPIAEGPPQLPTQPLCIILNPLLYL